MLINRRQFLNRVAVFSAVGMAPRFLTAAAADEVNAIEGFKDDRVLVVVQLGGGNDGLNTVVPHGIDDYYRARPNLGLRSGDVLRINDEIALNAKMPGLMSLYDAGKLAIVQGVGYPNPDRSHFRSMEIWHTASESDEFLSRGWIGRYFDNCCDGAPRPQVGMAIGERPQAFEGEKGLGIAASDPNKFGWQAGKGQDELEPTFKELNAGLPGGAGTLDFLQHTATNAILSSKEVQEAAKRGGVEPPARTGKRGAPQLDTVAGLIRGGLATRIYYVSVGGFDTHVNQVDQHGRLLSQFAEAMEAFQGQLERDGTADRVTTMVFSEFGRRVHENGGGGTDHGTAAPLFLMGKHVKAGIHGKLPSLTDLDDGDLKYNVDFRAVYATLINDWFAADPTKVLGAKYDSLGLIA
jgi:uncharacterized protein (DUF1501 family)